jgi:uncharacterized protein (DUF1778 family)
LTRKVFVVTLTGMARPKKPKGEAKAKLFQIRVTEEERQLFAEAAKAKSLDASSWARSELLALARRIIRNS